MTLQNADSQVAQIASAPIAKKIRVVTPLHGEQLIDDYAWMRNREDADLMPHLEAENRYAEAFMADTTDLQKALYAEMRGYIKEADSTVPTRRGRYVYYTRTEEGQQYSKRCRRLNKPNAEEEIYLDCDALAVGHDFFAIGPSALSPSGNFLAYSVDTKGFRQYTLVVKNLRTGQILTDTAERVTSIVWAADNKTLFYTTEDETTKRSDRLYRHLVGQKAHHLVFEEKDELFRVGVGGARNRHLIYLNIGSHQTEEWRYIDAKKPRSEFQVILPRKQGIRYSVEDDGRNFYLLTNEEATNFRLVKTPIGTTGKENWEEVIAHNPKVYLRGMALFAKHLVAYTRENGLGKVRIQDLRTGNVHYVSFPEPVYEVSSGGNMEFDVEDLRLNYESLVTPASTFDCDLSTGALTLVKQKEVPGYDPSLYKSERIFATADDGTMVPMSLVYKGDVVHDGGRHLHLYAYGSYGYGMPTDFRSSRLTLLNRGVIYVIAHPRGGNEMGEEWHEQGRMQHKMNTFTDFNSCAAHLIANGYTSADRLTIEGASAGGLLMGAVLNLRPELYKAALVGVPFVDVLNTMLDETLPLTVGEFEEWGNPKVEEQYRWMRPYSPYDNIEAKNYPAVLVFSAFHDSQVMYWEPAKYVAKLRDLKTDTNPVLFKIMLGGGGHGGASGRFDYLNDLAFRQAFILKELGITA
jgi:oligopeptidase B